MESPVCLIETLHYVDDHLIQSDALSFPFDPGHRTKSSGFLAELHDPLCDPWTKGSNRADASRDEADRCSIGQPGERADIEADHLIHLLNVRIEERCRCPDASIVHQQRNARVRTQRSLDPGQIRLVVEIGCDRL